MSPGDCGECRRRIFESPCATIMDVLPNELWHLVAQYTPTADVCSDVVTAYAFELLADDLTTAFRASCTGPPRTFSINGTFLSRGYSTAQKDAVLARYPSLEYEVEVRDDLLGMRFVPGASHIHFAMNSADIQFYGTDVNMVRVSVNKMHEHVGDPHAVRRVVRARIIPDSKVSWPTAKHKPSYGAERVRGTNRWAVLSSCRRVQPRPILPGVCARA